MSDSEDLDFEDDVFSLDSYDLDAMADDDDAMLDYDSTSELEAR